MRLRSLKRYGVVPAAFVFAIALAGCGTRATSSPPPVIPGNAVRATALASFPSQAQINGVSGPSETFCMMVGINPVGNGKALVVTTRESKVAAFSLPTPAGYTQMNFFSVSCSSELIGGHWRRMAIPVPGGQGGVQSEIACSSATHCAFVGVSLTSKHFTFIDIINGARWSSLGYK